MRGYSFPGDKAGFENGSALHEDADIVLVNADPWVAWSTSSANSPRGIGRDDATGRAVSPAGYTARRLTAYLDGLRSRGRGC
jgi:hypothetical protein